MSETVALILKTPNSLGCRLEKWSCCGSEADHLTEFLKTAGLPQVTAEEAEEDGVLEGTYKLTQEALDDIFDTVGEGPWEGHR